MGLLRRKRIVIPAIVGALTLAGAGVAYAYFTSTGSGNGGAKGGTVQALTISQIGPGYDSLIAGSGDPYTQDQCMQGCTGPSELGNKIVLANPGDQQLVSVTVALRNWGPALTAAPITLSVQDTVAGPVSFPGTFDIPAATVIGAEPSVYNATFNVASQGIYVQNPFVYGITFGDPLGVAPGDTHGESSLNIALSSSTTDLSIGADATPGSIYLADSNANNNDFPTCVAGLPTSGFVAVAVDCGPSNPNNPGAYGNGGASSADIPAVEFDVVGGSTPPLYPGDTKPFGFAITNPNPGNVYVNQVAISVPADISGNVLSIPTDSGSGVSGCLATWFTVNGSPISIARNVAPGTTLFPGLVSITMTNTNSSQDSCEGATIGMTFSST